MNILTIYLSIYLSIYEYTIYVYIYILYTLKLHFSLDIFGSFKAYHRGVWKGMHRMQGSTLT